MSIHAVIVDLVSELKESVFDVKSFKPFFLENLHGALVPLCNEAYTEARDISTDVRENLCAHCPVFKNEVDWCAQPLSPYSNLVTAFAQFQDGFISEPTFDSAVDSFLSKISN